MYHLCVTKTSSMEAQTIFLKGMVCNRCVMTVDEALRDLGHTPVKVSLGEISFVAGPHYDPAVLKDKLSALGFTLLEDRNTKVANQVKQLVAEVYNGEFDFPTRFRFTTLVQERLGRDYEGISDAFITAEKKTVEQYMIEYRINKIKEFLVYTDSTLADIAFRLNYSSAAYLSTQFKQHTGLSPFYFREIRKEKAANADVGCG